MVGGIRGDRGVERGKRGTSRTGLKLKTEARSGNSCLSSSLPSGGKLSRNLGNVEEWLQISVQFIRITGTQEGNLGLVIEPPIFNLHFVDEHSGYGRPIRKVIEVLFSLFSSSYQICMEKS